MLWPKSAGVRSADVNAVPNWLYGTWDLSFTGLAGR
jgi:hypothetical protein